jgi:hypothetical protein
LTDRKKKGEEMITAPRRPSMLSPVALSAMAGLLFPLTASFIVQTIVEPPELRSVKALFLWCSLFAFLTVVALVAWVLHLREYIDYRAAHPTPTTNLP